MKNAVLNDTTIVKTSDIYADLALTMNLKVRFHTEDDNEEIFTNNNSY